MIVWESTTHGIDLRTGADSRSPGVHLSGVLKVLANQHGLWDQYPEEEEIDYLITNTPAHQTGSVAALMRVAVGYAWEEWLSKRIPGLLYHPGEFELDGVIGTPDGICVVEPESGSGSVILHEIKATWMKSTKPVTEGTKLYWLWECMGYLAMLSKAFQVQCTRAVLHPLYVNGNYGEWGTRCQYRPLEITFTWEEIMANWGNVLVNKEKAKAERGQG